MGAVSIENGQLRFVSDANFDSVQLEYLISDGQGGEDTANVTLVMEQVSTAPIITVPADIQVAATGLFTQVVLGVATAVDANGESLAVSLLSDVTSFAPGANTVYWQATDSNGVSTITQQQVWVFPQVSFALDQQVVEGGIVIVKVVLNGDSPTYPLTVKYQVMGSADAGDHSLIDGEIVLTSREGFIVFDIFEDLLAESIETIVLSLADDVNQGSSNSRESNAIS